MEVHGGATSLVTDGEDRVYVFTLSTHPVIACDRDGGFLDSWGEGVFTHTRGVPTLVRRAHPRSSPIARQDGAATASVDLEEES